MTTISDGTTTLDVVSVSTYSSARSSANIVHTILGRESPDVTLRPAQKRRGRLEMLFGGEADSVAAENLLATEVVFTLSHSTVASVDMTFVIDQGGRIERYLDTTRKAWLISVDYQEIEL